MSRSAFAFPLSRRPASAATPSRRRPPAEGALRRGAVRARAEERALRWLDWTVQETKTWLDPDDRRRIDLQLRSARARACVRTRGSARVCVSVCLRAGVWAGLYARAYVCACLFAHARSSSSSIISRWRSLHRRRPLPARVWLHKLKELFYKAKFLSMERSKAAMADATGVQARARAREPSMALRAAER